MNLKLKPWQNLNWLQRMHGPPSNGVVRRVPHPSGRPHRYEYERHPAVTFWASSEVGTYRRAEHKPGTVQVPP